MPTESNNIIQKQIFFEDRFGNIQKLGELQQFEINNTDEKDDAVDALRYAVETKTEKEGTISFTISKESSMHLQKMFGIKTIKRKRFIKLLMGYGIQRNEAKEIANIMKINGQRYTSVLVKIIINFLFKGGANNGN